MDKIIAEVIKYQDYDKLGNLVDSTGEMEWACTCEFTDEKCIGIGCIFVNPIKMIASFYSAELRQYVYDNCTLGLLIYDDLGDDVMAELAYVAPRLLYVGSTFDRSIEFGYSRYEVCDGKLVIFPRYYCNYIEDEYTTFKVDLSELTMLVMIDNIYDTESMPMLSCIYCYSSAECPSGFDGNYYNGETEETPLQIYEQKYAHYNKSARNI